jgi:hypothetical protein
MSCHSLGALKATNHEADDRRCGDLRSTKMLLSEPLREISVCLTNFDRSPTAE